MEGRDSDSETTASSSNRSDAGNSEPTRRPGTDSPLRRSDRVIANFVKNAWPLLIAVLAAGTSLLTLLGLAYDRFPALRPVPPAEIRRVEILEATIVERQRVLPRTGGVAAHVVFFDAEAVGYDADDVQVDTLWIDAQTLQRAEPELQEHAIWTAYTRTDRIVGWLDVTYPANKLEGSAGCMFVRVFLYPAYEGDATPAGDRLPFMLAYADTPPIDVYNLNGSACADLDPTPAIESELGNDMLSDRTGV